MNRSDFILAVAVLAGTAFYGFSATKERAPKIWDLMVVVHLKPTRSERDTSDLMKWINSKGFHNVDGPEYHPKFIYFFGDVPDVSQVFRVQIPPIDLPKCSEYKFPSNSIPDNFKTTVSEISSHYYVSPVACGVRAP